MWRDRPIDDSSGRRICMGSLRFRNANFLNLCHGNCGVERRIRIITAGVCNLTRFQEFMRGGGEGCKS